MPLPYENSTAGDSALGEIQKILSRFGCETFGVMTDARNGKTIIQFTHRDKSVSLEASWKGYAAAWLKANPHTYRTKRTKVEHEAHALAQAKISVCSILRDWVKGQIMAVECGLMSFEAIFLSHMLLPNGMRVVEIVQRDILKLPENSTNSIEA
jgi:hypothetical protein